MIKGINKLIVDAIRDGKYLSYVYMYITIWILVIFMFISVLPFFGIDWLLNKMILKPIKKLWKKIKK